MHLSFLWLKVVLSYKLYQQTTGEKPKEEQTSECENWDRQFFQVILHATSLSVDLSSLVLSLSFFFISSYKIMEESGINTDVAYNRDIHGQFPHCHLVKGLQLQQQVFQPLHVIYMACT